MGKSYDILPKSKSHDTTTNKDLQFLHTVRRDALNSDVIIHDNRVEEIRLPNRGITEKRFGASVPEVQVRVTDEEGRTMTKILGRERPPNIRKGAHPAKQLIFYETQGRGLDMDEIKRVFFSKGRRWMREEDDFDDEIEDMVEEMLAENALIKLKNERYRSDINTDIGEVYDLEEEGFDEKEGVYPLEQLIWENVKEHMGLARIEIKNIAERWNWVRGRSATDYWLNIMLEKGSLEEPEDDFFMPGDTV